MTFMKTAIIYKTYSLDVSVQHYLKLTKGFPFFFCKVLIQEDGRKRELVVGVVRANHKLHKSAGESNDTVGYYTSDGHLLNACDKKDAKSAQPVEGIGNILE